MPQVPRSAEFGVCVAVASRQNVKLAGSDCPIDGTSIWVANANSNTVTRLRPKDGKLTGTFAVGSNPQFIAFDGTNLWVTNAGSNNITKLRDCDGAVLGTFHTGDYPVGIDFDGANVWTANHIGGSVSKR